jgi:YjbE family integral membrane protein
VIETLQAVIAIVLIDLTLSGDNAIVIGMAARGLPDKQRRTAIVFGGLAAVGVRAAAATVVTLLLNINYVQLIAAIVLVIIAYRMVQSAPAASGTRHVVQAVTLRGAIATILVADIAMGSDNVIGVGAAAQGSVALLVFGLALSIPIVLFGSALVVRLLDRLPQLVWLGVLALVWTAAEMIVDEPGIELAHALPLSSELIIAAVLLVVVVAMRGSLDARRRRRDRPASGVGSAAAD